MAIFDEPIVFEWDKGNKDKNFLKHKVTNLETEEVFQNEDIILFQDKKHSTENEKRYGLFGKTNKKRLLSIYFTWRREKIRIITARDMSRKERSIYEQKKKQSYS